ncbi:phosphomevalonate kinase [Microbacterium sp. W1N]|uniref:phosphomevalonate kinase n=1 Tax=Microbacterium festucae TaxID=2977531 RepID=UPI0021BF95C9|nr:phosphomevalonate kinase [Microbacterium festucae]MCT9820235.1 phosphomevalonate kinase [Microbacterium festucae]
MSPETIQTRAPGKLFVAGEYAVVTPGEPAVLVAVDRYITVRLTAAQDAGRIHSPEFGRAPLLWRRDADGLTIDRDRHPYDYVLAAVTLCERLRAERGLAPRFYDLHIDSGLDDVTGRKFGLGSSAAVTVAAVRAIDAFYDFGLDGLEIFRLSLLATVQVAPQASGGDVAASAFGGWIGYRSPDRALLRARSEQGPIDGLLHSDAWAGSEVTRLPPPDALRFLVGWTGSPASTVRLVDDVSRQVRSGESAHDTFLLRSRAVVDDLWRGLQQGDDAAALTAVRDARRLLQGLGASAGVAIETERLAALCDIAEAAGAAAKPSGAGGGDCGIVLAPPSADVSGILRAWEAHDIRHLTIAVHPPRGGVHEQ